MRRGFHIPSICFIKPFKLCAYTPLYSDNIIILFKSEIKMFILYLQSILKCLHVCYLDIHMPDISRA